MKESVKFLQKKLKKLVENLPYIRCEYEYFSFDDTHFVKILPKEQYEKNETYMKFEKEIIKEFIDKFPFEGITFFTGNDFDDLFEPTMFFEGILYKMFSLETINIETNSNITINFEIKKKIINSFFKLNKLEYFEIANDFWEKKEIELFDDTFNEDFPVDLDERISLAA